MLGLINSNRLDQLTNCMDGDICKLQINNKLVTIMHEMLLILLTIQVMKSRITVENQGNADEHT